MKKYKWLFVACLIISAVFCNGVVANAASIRSGDFSYHELEDGTVSIAYYYGTDTAVTIPSELDGKVVSEIGEHAFENNSELKTINIPNSVITIGKYAFSCCINLESAFLSEGIEKISRSSFTGCEKLKIINIPNSVKIIGEYAFNRCESLENITIPSTVTSIEGISFMFCNSLTIYTYPDSPLMKMNRYGFSVNCIEHPAIIKDKAVPSTCTQDGKTEGSHCSVCDYVVPQETIKATGHSWDEGVVTTAPTVTQGGTKTYTCKTCKETRTEAIPKLPAPQIGNTVTDSNSSYKVTEAGTTGGAVEYTATKKSQSTITIPDTVDIDGITYKVTTISKNAFKNNKKLKKVVIGKNITKIEANAFSGCKNLKTITVKSTKLKSVGKNAFKGINAKAKIKVPSGKLSKYKKMMGKKGQKSTVKIVK